MAYCSQGNHTKFGNRMNYIKEKTEPYHKILYGANVVYAEGWQQSKKRMAYSTIFPSILYRMKCPYSPENYLKGDYEVQAVTMKE